VLNATREPDLANEPVNANRAGQLGVQDLDCHGAIVTLIVGEPDGGHAALPKLSLDQVPVRQFGFESLAHRTTSSQGSGSTLSYNILLRGK
jgi:hypothetical protein